MRFPSLLLACLFAAPALYAQGRHAPYPEVVRAFYAQYTLPAEDPALLQFGKRPQGWTVQVINVVDMEVQREQLFWPLDSVAPTPLEGLGPAGSPEEQKATVDALLQGGTGPEFYNFSRLPLYGYEGWERATMERYGSQKELSDTLLDALGRAYSAYGDRFLSRMSVSQHRARLPGQAQLAPLEKPDRLRIDSALYFYGQAIAAFRRLAAQRPAYNTLVGNILTKQFCEEMHVYSMLDINGYPAEARLALDSIRFSESLRQVAHNYLDACPPNTILFTYGDNDTYPLWYVQDKEQYRRDVTVVNTSLAFLAVYIRSLEPRLRIGMQKELYSRPGFYYLLFRDDTNAGKRSITLKDLFDGLRTHAARTSETEPLPPYEVPVKHLELPLDQARFASIYPGNAANFSSLLRWKTNNVLTLDELLVLDVIRQNLTTRPIAFTSKPALHEAYLLPEGTVYRFVPMSATQKKVLEAGARRRQEAFLTNRFRMPEYAPDRIAYVAPVGTNWLVDLYTPLIGCYRDHNPAKAIKLFAELKSRQDIHRFYNSSLFDLAWVQWDLGDRKEGLALLTTALNKLRPEHLAETPGLDPYPAAQWDALRQWVLDELRKRKASEAELNALVDVTGPLFP
ncbi:MAG: hypothetical protein EOO16_20685 [Chitinophagaceae bacterium]|nr:MAG: hypothetical protein EOO16_20685 [Chitinophagaceae bacterium]